MREGKQIMNRDGSAWGLTSIICTVHAIKIQPITLAPHTPLPT